jgi:glycosyltransferase involved in cell wall biosynthesis
MNDLRRNSQWIPGAAPVAVVMISLNEAHNMREVLENLKGFAQEVILVDSYSVDDTVSIALEYGVRVVQRKFKGFGDQWNFALREIPISASWTMKMDPDERLTNTIKKSLIEEMRFGNKDGLIISIRLNFMRRPLPISINLLRAWRSGKAVMSDVLVNEHIRLDGKIGNVKGFIEHQDSPSLEHWFNKQNRYTTLEAIWQFQGKELAANPKLFGRPLERRMWLKRHFGKVPGRFLILFAYNYFFLGSWRAGRTGYIWARLRSDVYRLWEYKYIEMRMFGSLPPDIPTQTGNPDPRVEQYS